MPTPQHGTEALQPAEPASPEQVQLGEASTELQWPRDRDPILSDEPQVRSLPASPVPLRRLGLVALAIAGGAVLATLAIATHRRSRHVDTRSSATAVTLVAVAPPPVFPVPKTAVSAPTVAQPPDEGRDLPSDAAITDPLASTATPAAHARAMAPLVRTPPSGSAIPSAFVARRPGPGF
jgi:hypothetical protein